LNVPIGTVMSRISRGRRMMYEKLSPAAPVPAEAAGGRR
jgi:DNA-directed RNA polymerase specialized sigma24 family protein